MKIVQINATCGKGSTGRICIDISRELTERNVENYILYCGNKSAYPLGIQCGSIAQIKAEALCSHIDGLYGFNSKNITNQLLHNLEAIQPNIVHLHNIHGHNCNLELLFNYLSEHRIKAIWTFHDCWAFTAYCPHFTMAQCDKWKCGCHNCPQCHEYSFFFDRSKELYKKKKRLADVLDLMIVTPSYWLADLTKQSFFNGHPVKVINNGVDLKVFKPTLSNFRKKHSISDDKYIVLGVAFDWGIRKGLDVFVELSRRLDKKYQIVLVGTDKTIDKKLPNNIITINRTQSQNELAEIYTAADVFVNPTREEVFGLVNIEALACGTPGITFKTGGSPECYDETCGSVVAYNDIDTMEKEIVRVCDQRPYSKEACIKKALCFDKNIKIKEYMKLYEEIDV